MPHFWGCVPRGYDRHIRTQAEIFVQCTYPQILSYVYTFGSYRVEKHTNKQTPLKTSNALRYATTFDNNNAKFGYPKQRHAYCNAVHTECLKLTAASSATKNTRANLGSKISVVSMSLNVGL